MTHACLHRSRILSGLVVLLFSTSGLRAQDPSSVDIDLRQSTLVPNELEVYIRANGQSFGDVLSGLTFTLRWVTTSPATFGTRVNACPEGINIAPTAQITDPLVDDVPTGYNYRTYNAFGLELLSDWGCTLPQDEWYLVMTVPVENNTGCTEFNIVNDSFTDSPGNARDYYVSLGGIDKTGIIEPTSVFIGECALDCEGMVGGSALPGTPCDDGDPDTENDLYNAECLCAGVALGITDPGTSVLVMRIMPNPSATSQVLLHAEGTVLRSASLVDIEVFNPLGLRVLTERAASSKGILNHRLDLGADIGAGLYLVNVTIDGQRHTERLIIH